MTDKTQRTLSLILNIAAAYLFISLLYGWSGGELAFFAPGIFFFRSFHAAALYLPVFIALVARLILFEPIPRKSIFRLNLFMIPFLSSSLMLKVMISGPISPAEYYFTTAFGRGTSMVLLGLLTLVSSLLIIKFSDILYPGEEGVFPSLGAWFNDLLPVVDRSEEDTLQDELPVVKQDKVPVEEDSKNSAQDDVPFQTPSFPEGVRPVPGSLGRTDDDLHDLIGKVLRGETELQKDVPNKDYQDFMDTSEDFAPINSEERDVLDVVSGRKGPELSQKPLMRDDSATVRLNNDNEAESPVEKAVTTESSMEAAAPPGSGNEIETSANTESAEEQKLDSLLSALNNVLEEDRPQSISDKLSPEMPETVESVENSSAKLPESRKKRKNYEVPVEGLLNIYPGSDYSQVDDDTRNAARVLEETLSEFKIDAEVTGISRGPVITMFELLPAPGVKLSRIVALQDNIGMRLAASRVRIVAPIPGKHAVGIEIPNKKRSLVGFSQLVANEDMNNGKKEIPIVLGKDISGGSQVIDLTRTPHLLIAGSTGSGKSVCVNSLICSILYRRSPQDVKMILVDPKIVELKLYNDIPHLLTPVITEPKKAFQAVQWALYEMERRYSLLDGLGVRDIKSYNKRIKERNIATEKLPYIVVVIDEFADLMATSGKELEGIVARLAAMSRAVGIHLVLATQRPSTDVITGLIKANFPSRIAFMVASMTDSRIIIDTAGAEKLLGRGDMLFTSSWDPFPTRVQGAFLSEEEVENVVGYVKTLGEPEYIDDEIFVDEEEDADSFSLRGDTGDDPLFDKALEVVVNSGKASASYLQRRLKIGYNRAARLVEDMEERGIVGPANGSKPRELLHIPERPSIHSEEPSIA